MPDFVGGLDLGQRSDYSALSLLERTTHESGKSAYLVRYLRRWPLGTPYLVPPGQPPGIGEDLRDLLAKEPLRGCLLAIDQTGVGRGVVDAYRALDLPVSLVPITITGGSKAAMEPDGSWHVPKRELVAVLQVLLQQQRLSIAAGLSLASTLAEEMQTFKVKVTAAGNETTEAWREKDHDDIVLSVALSAWLAERMPAFGPDSIGTGGRSAVDSAPAGVFGTQNVRDWPRRF